MVADLLFTLSASCEWNVRDICGNLHSVCGRCGRLLRSHPDAILRANRRPNQALRSPDHSWVREFPFLCLLRSVLNCIFRLVGTAGYWDVSVAGNDSYSFAKAATDAGMSTRS